MKIKIKLWKKKRTGEIYAATPVDDEFFDQGVVFEKVSEFEHEISDESKHPRDWWLDLQGGLIYNNPYYDRKEGYVHAREVLPGSVQVTREQLAKAWDALVTAGHIHSGSLYHPFAIFCRALGLEES